MDSWKNTQTLPLYKNASALVVSENEKGSQLMLQVFYKSAVLRTKVLFNKNSEVIAFYVQFACQCGLNDVILHLSSWLGSPLQRFLWNFFFFRVAVVHYLRFTTAAGSMLLVVNMELSRAVVLHLFTPAGPVNNAKYFTGRQHTIAVNATVY